MLLLLLLLLLPLLLQVLAKAEPTALAGSAEVVRAKLIAASAIAKGEVRPLCAADGCSVLLATRHIAHRLGSVNRLCSCHFLRPRCKHSSGSRSAFRAQLVAC
jgi:hypothetical protein